MKEVVFDLEVHDVPDILPRIIQTIHRRGGSVRSWSITMEKPWARARISVHGVDNPNAMIRNLEKLVDVRRVHAIAT